MDNTIAQILQFVEDNDVKFIRLAFCDIFGNQKNISIMSTELTRAFESGISFDASSVSGFMNVEDSDLLLFPDATTLSVLPWRPSQGRVIRFYCNIKYPDGTPFEGDGRHLLRLANQKAKDLQLNCKIGTECEFYLFELDDRGLPTKRPHDNAGYLDISPLDKSEDVRRQICLTLEEMGIMPETSHHESGAGQNEIDFKYSDALEAADNMITYKSVVKAIANGHGLFASFLPKPLEKDSGSGLHVNLSLFNMKGENLFRVGNEHSKISESFIAGILDKIAEITVFLNPLTNSYARLGEFEAPRYISWSHQNRSQLIRIPAATGKFTRMELRSPDCTLNPYIGFSLIIHAGLEGIKNNLELPAACDINLFNATIEDIEHYKQLPSTLSEAISIARKSDFINSYLPRKTTEYFLDAKQREWDRYISHDNKRDIEDSMYFNIN